MQGDYIQEPGLPGIPGNSGMDGDAGLFDINKVMH
jgi:hypothetical protein